MKRGLASVLAAVAVLVGVTPTAGAAETEQHCFVRVIDKEADGELVTSPPQCYASEATRDRAARTATTKGSFGSRTQSTIVLATHYDGASYSGSSTSVVGNDCLGGWLNTDSYWKAHMASTQNGCAKVVHYYGTGLTPPTAATTRPGGNLGTLTDHVWSVQYTT